MTVKLRSFIEDLNDNYYVTKDNAAGIVYLDPYDKLEDLRIAIQNRDVNRICEYAIAQAMMMNCDMQINDSDACALVRQRLDQLEGPITDEVVWDFVAKTIGDIVD